MKKGRNPFPSDGRGEAGAQSVECDPNQLQICHPSIPDGLLIALERECRHLNYTRAQTIYYCVAADYRYISVGVFGDGDNAAYEWFIWDEDSKTLRTSNVGYGCPGVALCCGLVEAGAHKANGDHDLFLTWGRNPPRSRESDPATESGTQTKGDL